MFDEEDRKLSPTGGDVSQAPTLPNPPVDIDRHTAQPRRMRDYLLGGAANFPVDREVTHYVSEVLPGGTDTARAAFRAVRAFAVRVLRYLAAEVGMRQFLSVGTNLPTVEHFHETIQEIAPDARIVYVIDNDFVMAHAHRLCKGTPEGATAYIREMQCRPQMMLAHAGETLDLSQPVAVFIQGVLLHLHDDEAYQVVSELLAGVAPGSSLALYHLASDLLVEQTAVMWQRMRQMADESKMPQLIPRSRAGVSRFFEGLELVEPGVVPVEQWRPDPAEPLAGAPTAVYGGVGRKP
jgi:hypothetical protein